MARPENGLYIIHGEVNLLVTAMRRNTRWASHAHQDEEQDPLINNFALLKDILNTVADLSEVAPNEFLGPFLEVIRSEDTTGPITGLALTSVNKFLSYGLIEAKNESAAPAIENIADAVTHARFVGTDPGSDEVVLMKILHVLRTLLLTPAGAQLTNESVCEIMQSCFRICFEMRLSELLRRSAEHTLMDMVQLLFSRLPQFKEDAKWASSMRKLKMRTGVMDSSRGKKRRSPKSRHKRASTEVSPVNQSAASAATSETPATTEPCGPEEMGTSVEDGERRVSTGPLAVTTQVAESMETGEEVSAPSGEDPPAALPTQSPTTSPAEEVLNAPDVIATTPVSHSTNVVDIHEGFRHASEQESMEEAGPPSMEEPDSSNMEADQHHLQVPCDLPKSSSDLDLSMDTDKGGSLSDLADDGESTAYSAAEQSDGASVHESEYINPRGVRFMPHQHVHDGSGPLVPYGLPCVRELFRFLISLTNPLDRHNTDVMIHMGLSLLTVALEAGADHIPAFTSLLALVRDDMCKHLFFLLQSERLTLFAASIRVCFLLFEALRSHLKFQLEMYLTRLMDIIVSESPRISYEQRELSLESIVQILRIPGLVTELYLNYDCDLYCSNLFEDLMKMLSKNAFPVSGLFSTHVLSLDALLAVIDSIEQHCHHRVLHSSRDMSPDTEVSQSDSPERTKSEVHQSGEESTPAGSGEATQVASPPLPPASGFTTAQQMLATKAAEPGKPDTEKKPESRKGPQIRPNRMKVAQPIPTEEDLAAIKHKKKLYQQGTDHFNTKPAKGIAFLQEQGLLATPIDCGQVVTFLKENPKLDKKQIGEYISNKKNKTIFEAYQKSFNFHETRVDESLRMFLETFRLPGEAPVISYLLEAFAEHWHKTNGEPFYNADAAFTLAYACIMLNVDQHNLNAKKQNIPMTCEEFKKNLKAVNGGKDFDQDMLNEMFEAIKSEEIVMPAEQTGLVKELYLWRVLLRRGSSKEGTFFHAPTGSYDRDLFALVWGPTVAALSFVFDKSLDKTIIQKAISGFRKCAMISAHYGLSDVFDNLVISLCKFTTLLSAPESADMIPVAFGSNQKAQLAAQTVFGLAHRHGDILREGWKNILDCMLQLHRAKLLPKILRMVEDFVDPSGRISLIREEVAVAQRIDTGVLSSVFSYFTMAEPTQQRGPSPEEQEASRQAERCIQECHVEQLITESKFLRIDSLQELLKALIFASRYPEMQETMNGLQCEEDAAVFYLELLIRVVLENKDRTAPFWQSIREHLYNLIVNASDHTFLVERAVVGLLRLSIRLLRREEITAQVLSSLSMLLLMKPSVIHAVSRQVAFGLHELLKTNAANIHAAEDWYTLFTLLEVVGAGTDPPPLMQATYGVNVPESLSDAGAQSDSEVSAAPAVSEASSDRGYTSDSELYSDSNHERAMAAVSAEVDVKPIAGHGSWLLVTPEDVADSKTKGGGSGAPVNQYTIALNEELKHHDMRALVKSCETLAFLVRDAAHVTPHNFESCVHLIRTFVEGSLNGGPQAKQKQNKPASRPNKKYKLSRRKQEQMNRSKSSPTHLNQLQDSDEEREIDGYHSLSIQLLDLMHTLHTRAATIFSSWAQADMEPQPPQSYEPTPPAAGEVGSTGDPTATQSEVRDPYHSVGETVDAGTSTLWIKCWCPLLQGIARLCCDSRRHVRSQALTYLQRALLVHDLQTLSAAEWESCFNKVLFPLLANLLENINPNDPTGIEETRMRASTLLCKVFLQHLTPLLSLSTFTALWLTILEFMDKYMHADKSDLLCEAIPESLKNMLLVMQTAGILASNPETDQSQLWKLTWDRIDTFLPNLRTELFKPHHIAEPRPHTVSREAVPPESPPRGTSPPPPSGSPAEDPHSAASGSPTHISAETSGSTQTSPGRPASPLNSTEGLPSAATLILHPPLPDASATPAPPATVPILLNPELIQAGQFPIISPQSTPERKPEVSGQGQ